MGMSDKDHLDHAWRYFQLHATQRITVFNFYVAASGLMVAGLIYSLRGGNETALYSVAAGIGLVLLSTVFWKLDRRVRAMIKASEGTIIKIEGACIEEPDHRVMTNEQKIADATKYSLFGNWTYGEAFRRIFAVVGTFGFLGAGFGGWQLSSYEPHKAAQTEQQQITPSLPAPKATEVDAIAPDVPSPAEPSSDPVGAEGK